VALLLFRAKPNAATEMSVGGGGISPTASYRQLRGEASSVGDGRSYRDEELVAAVTASTS